MRLLKQHTPLAAAVLIAVLAAILSACGSAVDTPVEPDATPILFGTKAGSAFTVDRYSRATPSATEDPDSYTPVMPATIGVFGEMQHYINHIFTSEQIFYYKHSDLYARVEPQITAENGFAWNLDNDGTVTDADADLDNDWAYAPLRYWSHASRYQFYCYAPHHTYNSTAVNLDKTIYGQMKTLTLSNIPPYSAMSYMMAEAYVEASSGTVQFDMRHISARLCVRLMIGEQYSRLRTIKVKKVSINDRTIGGRYYECKASFTDDPADYTHTITTTTAYTPDPTNPEIYLIPIFDDPDGLELLNDRYRQFGSLYTMPQTIPSITVNVTYDVYDKDADGNTGRLIRADQRVSNTLELNRDVVEGRYYNLNVLISPAFLYVLSDNDAAPDMLLDVADPSLPTAP